MIEGNVSYSSLRPVTFFSCAPITLAAKVCLFTRYYVIGEWLILAYPSLQLLVNSKNRKIAVSLFNIDF